jgi:nucleotide-binding universal stress UspA family protein
VLLDGDPSTALHRSAVDIAADLVVMASHGRRGLARLVLGSITEDVVRAGGVPVLVVPRADVQEEEGRGGPTPEALEAPLPRHLLVALDGSREAEAILEPAVGLARMLGSLVTVATVRDDERSPRATLLPTSILDTESSGERAGAPVPAEPAGEESPDPVPGSAAGDSEYLDGIARRLAGEGCSAVPRVLAGPQVVDRLLACPDELGVDWFALTSHGHGLWKRWIEGSVAEALLQRATVPVLLLHPHPTR